MAEYFSLNTAYWGTAYIKKPTRGPLKRIYDQEYTVSVPTVVQTTSCVAQTCPLMLLCLWYEELSHSVQLRISSPVQCCYVSSLIWSFVILLHRDAFFFTWICSTVAWNSRFICISAVIMCGQRSSGSEAVVLICISTLQSFIKTLQSLLWRVLQRVSQIQANTNTGASEPSSDNTQTSTGTSGAAAAL